ncbi:Protein of unknown function (DUF489) [gamma proteobacterium HdN1]|nr:Protein of unknown function (DUF489) [gamma proteobacterium HdN1]
MAKNKNPLNQRHKAMALAGIFQATALVQQLARTGELSRTDLDCLMGSIFVMDPQDVSEVYGGVKPLSHGIDILLEILDKNQTQRYGESIRYAVGLLNIERQLRRKSDLLALLRSRLEQLDQQRVHFDSISHSSVIARLAQLYVDTMGTLRFRIQVKGDPRHLTQEETANKVRAVFLAGVRSAILWRQLGGSRTDFFLRKRALVVSLRELKQEAMMA